MFKSLWGKFDDIEKLFIKLSNLIETSLDSSFEAVKEFRDNGSTELVDELYKKTHQAETEADEVGREIVDIILEGSLLPNTRGDLMNLIDNLDDIADHAERIMDSIVIIGVDVSIFNGNELDKMFDLIKKQYKILKEAVSSLFKNMDLALGKAAKLEALESEIDDLENDIKRKLAAIDELEMAEKIAYSNLISEIGYLADIIENVGEKIEIFIAVRKG